MSEATIITKECRDEEGPSTIPGKEEKSTHPILIQLVSGHMILHLETDAL